MMYTPVKGGALVPTAGPTARQHDADSHTHHTHHTHHTKHSTPHTAHTHHTHHTHTTHRTVASVGQGGNDTHTMLQLTSHARTEENETIGLPRIHSTRGVAAYDILPHHVSNPSGSIRVEGNLCRQPPRVSTLTSQRACTHRCSRLGEVRSFLRWAHNQDLNRVRPTKSLPGQQPHIRHSHPHTVRTGWRHALHGHICTRLCDGCVRMSGPFSPVELDFRQHDCHGVASVGLMGTDTHTTQQHTSTPASVVLAGRRMSASSALTAICAESTGRSERGGAGGSVS
jgi:hypothetical protein